jgi:hypothetical protein
MEQPGGERAQVVLQSVKMYGSCVMVRREFGSNTTPIANVEWQVTDTTPRSPPVGKCFLPRAIPLRYCPPACYLQQWRNDIWCVTIDVYYSTVSPMPGAARGISQTNAHTNRIEHSDSFVVAKENISPS